MSTCGDSLSLSLTREIRQIDRSSYMIGFICGVFFFFKKSKVVFFLLELRKEEVLSHIKNSFRMRYQRYVIC